VADREAGGELAGDGEEEEGAAADNPARPHRGNGHLEGDGGAVEESEERVLDPLDLVRPHVVDWGDAAKGKAGEEGAEEGEGLRPVADRHQADRHRAEQRGEDDVVVALLHARQQLRLDEARHNVHREPADPRQQEDRREHRPQVAHAPEFRVGEHLELAEVDEGDDVVDNSGEQDELAEGRVEHMPHVHHLGRHADGGWHRRDGDDVRCFGREADCGGEAKGDRKGQRRAEEGGAQRTRPVRDEHVEVDLKATRDHLQDEADLADHHDRVGLRHEGGEARAEHHPAEELAGQARQPQRLGQLPARPQRNVEERKLLDIVERERNVVTAVVAARVVRGRAQPPPLVTDPLVATITAEPLVATIAAGQPAPREPAPAPQMLRRFTLSN